MEDPSNNTKMEGYWLKGKFCGNDKVKVERYDSMTDLEKRIHAKA